MLCITGKSLNLSESRFLLWETGVVTVTFHLAGSLFGLTGSRTQSTLQAVQCHATPILIITGHRGLHGPSAPAVSGHSAHVLCQLYNVSAGLVLSSPWFWMKRQTWGRKVGFDLNPSWPSARPSGPDGARCHFPSRDLHRVHCEQSLLCVLRRRWEAPSPGQTGPSPQVPMEGLPQVTGGFPQVSFHALLFIAPIAGI